MSLISSKQEFDEVALLGIRFHKLKVYQLIDYIIKAAKLKKKKKNCCGQREYSSHEFCI